MKTLRRYALWFAGVAACTTLYLLRGSGTPVTTPKPPVSMSEKPRPPLLTPGQLFAEARAMASSGAGDTEGGHQKANQADEIKGSLDKAIEQVLNEDPILRRFYDLRQKALRTAAEQKDYQAMLADANLILEARDELRGAYSNTGIDQGEELRRLQRVHYLNSAVAWKENPERPTALAAISELILEDVPKSLAAEAKGSLLGDKIDLFQHLMLSDPDKAQMLLTRAQGTRSEKLLRLAYGTGEQDKQPQH